MIKIMQLFLVLRPETYFSCTLLLQDIESVFREMNPEDFTSAGGIMP